MQGTHSFKSFVCKECKKQYDFYNERQKLKKKKIKKLCGGDDCGCIVVINLCIRFMFSGAILII